MLRNCVMLTCVLVLGCAGASNAQPRESRGTVYIGGLPCSSLCRSYLAWAHALSSTHKQGRQRVMVVTRGKRTRGAGSKLAARTRVAKAEPVAANSNQVTPAKLADPRPAADAVADFDQTATKTADPHPKAVPAVGPDAETTREQVRTAMRVAAMAVPAAERKAGNRDGSDHPTAPPADVQEAAAATPNDTELQIVLVMARPQIRSVSDLASKTIAVDEDQSVSNGDVRAAIVAAGAADVELSVGETKALDRLISGTVSAAVLALVSPEAALRFPDIEGFKIFQVLLLSRSAKPAADTPLAK